MFELVSTLRVRLEVFRDMGCWRVCTDVETTELQTAQPQQVGLRQETPGPCE